ncbi:hypothetical protein K1T71_014057 [Dendrolimus kikuchii]|uniref:Uncharacterized protein n=1 Tax=Dendrolimus kikuchii TaxID=765133 RepID=A0ACC1CEX2_9NEOP|nr:hypothetical protein K1T71_014057 [Dendrolimus kikuchii]
MFGEHGKINCTDPRTMQKHAAYSEWADAYSCTKHRCQPGGRNLAIYTVGCKRVEAPESAIECEEVVEDTNIQFPFCCTRLRCLVVVRGEVWTRVLGQPWETLPAAPWSHMYKMKKPPPPDSSFLPKNGEKGPVYELSEPATDTHDKILRTKKTTEAADCNEAIPRAAPAPDIVIALSTNNDSKDLKKTDNQRHKRGRHTSSFSDDEQHNEVANEPVDVEDVPISTDTSQHHQIGWTEVTQNQWNDHESGTDMEANKDGSFHQPDFPAQEPEKKDEKPSNLQALVDAIGTRMRDIENVVQRMSEKVHQNKPTEPDLRSFEKMPRSTSDSEIQKHQRSGEKDHDKEFTATKRPGSEGGHYKRFSVKNRGSKYLHGASEGTEQPFVEDNNMNGYFNDASNSVLRRANPPKEPAPTYMAPVDTRRKEPAHIIVSDSSDDIEKKRKKKHHKKRRGKGRGHKKHHKDDKKKPRVSSEVDKNVVSLEDSSALVNS